MASLIKRDGKYHVQWYEGTKKRRRSLRTESLQIAKEKLRQFESARFRSGGCGLPTRTPVGEIVAAYIDHMKAHRPERSWQKDLTHLRHNILRVFKQSSVARRRFRAAGAAGRPARRVRADVLVVDGLRANLAVARNDIPRRRPGRA